jgi:acetyl/propionyl-CoA carboxylase alpha subunit
VKTYWVRLGHEELEVAVDEADGALVVTLAGSTHRVELAEIVPGWYSLIVDGRCHDLAVRERGGPWTLSLDGAVHVIEIARTRRLFPGPRPEGTPRTHEVRAPMPGLLVAVQVEEGAQVVIGQPLVIMEAMKMQMEIRTPHAGTIRRVHVVPGQELTAGQPLITVDES